MAETFGQRFDQHTDDIIDVTELLKELSDREGQYVWKKLTTEGGDFVDYVVSDDLSAYPDRGYVGQYWYERMESLIYTYDEETITEGSASTEPEGSLHFII